MPSDDISRLVDDITIDAYGVDEQATAFCQAFTEEVPVPVVAEVLGIQVEVTGFDYLDERRGVIARCRRGGTTQDLAVADLVFSPDTPAAWVQAAYRHWLGLRPYPAVIPPEWTLSWL